MKGLKVNDLEVALAELKGSWHLERVVGVDRFVDRDNSVTYLVPDENK